MSFSSNVKDELCQLKLSNLETQMYELEAMLRLSSEITISEGGIGVLFQTTNPLVAKRLLALLKNYIKCDVSIASKKVNKLNQNNSYMIDIKSMSDAIIEEFGLLTSSKNQIIILDNEEFRSAYLRGAFLVKGSVNSPESSNYHLEICVSSENYAKWLTKLFGKYHKLDLEPKFIKRRDKYVIYFKKKLYP